MLRSNVTVDGRNNPTIAISNTIAASDSPIIFRMRMGGYLWSLKIVQNISCRRSPLKYSIWLFFSIRHLCTKKVYIKRRTVLIHKGE